MSDLVFPEPTDLPERVHGQSIRERLMRTSPTVFTDPDMRQLYVDTYLTLCIELETVPGFGVAMMMLAERYAFLHTSMKNYDSLDTALEPLQYERLVLRFGQMFDRLLKGRDERTADETFKRQFMNAMINAVADAIEEAIPDRVEAQRVQAHIATHMRRATVTSGVGRPA